MLPCCPGQTWLNRSCLARTVVGWVVPMVRSGARAWARAEQRYTLLSCLGSAAAVAVADQLGAAPRAKQLVHPAAEGAARQTTAAAAVSSSTSSRGNSSSRAAAISGGTATKGGRPQQQLQQLHSSGQRARYTYSTL